MENTTKNTLDVIRLEKDERANAKVYYLPQWADLKERILTKLDEYENKTIAEVFGNKSEKGASFSHQTLANLQFTSAGAIREKWLKYASETLKAQKAPSVYDFLSENLVPLTAEELKAIAERKKHEAEITAKAQGVFAMFELTDNYPTAEAFANNAKAVEKFGLEVVTKVCDLLKEHETA